MKCPECKSWWFPYFPCCYCPSKRGTELPRLLELYKQKQMKKLKQQPQQEEK